MLPEGLFYRVQPAYFGQALEVQLRQRRLIGSRVLEETFVYAAEFASPEAGIAAAKATVLKRFVENERHRSAYRAALKLTGDSVE
ncbi:hypothetical protein [Streptomyces sp. NPDC001876]|uniref:hypothetical protein n=1 Tax=Streptomyces sp. NPDC001876 TaxID=3154402 RepID=UPI00332C81F7